MKHWGTYWGRISGSDHARARTLAEFFWKAPVDLLVTALALPDAMRQKATWPCLFVHFTSLVYYIFVCWTIPAFQEWIPLGPGIYFFHYADELCASVLLRIFSLNSQGYGSMVCIRAMLASQNESGSVPSSSVLWKSWRRIGLASLNVGRTHRWNHQVPAFSWSWVWLLVPSPYPLQIY